MDASLMSAGWIAILLFSFIFGIGFSLGNRVIDFIIRALSGK